MNRRLTGHTAVALLLASGSAVAYPAAAVAGPAGSITLLSAAPDGSPAAGFSTGASISADGRYAVFSSTAANLVPDDTNRAEDVFVVDRRTGDVERVTVDSAGRQSAGGGGDPTISADGRFVAFESFAADLVASDTNRTWDVFVHDRQTGATTRVSVGGDGAQAEATSLDPTISADGRSVAFASSAANLVAGDTNENGDVFVRDLDAGVTTRISVDSAGVEGGRFEYSGRPSISADGRVVVFESQANLDHAPASVERGFTNVFSYDRSTGATTRVSVTATGAAHGVGRGDCIFPAVSGDGRFVAFTTDRNLLSADTNFVSDVFLFDRETSATTLVSRDTAGAARGAFGPPVVSGDGRYVAFASESPDLLPGDTNDTQDVFRFDRQAAATSFVAVADDGTLSNGYTYGPAISADGRHVAFSTERVTNLAPRTVDTHSVFLRDFETP